MVQMHIVIMDYSDNTVRAFSRAFEVGADVEYELMKTGEFNPDTSYLMFTYRDIHIDINDIIHILMHD